MIELDIARINKSTLIVENIEVADQEWIDNANATDETYMFVVYTEENPAIIGLSWSEKDGFEQLDPEDY